jgi:hypothetical protein
MTEQLSPKQQALQARRAAQREAKAKAKKLEAKVRAIAAKTHRELREALEKFK